MIGVSKYTNGWRDLPGVENDLRQVSQALEDNGFEVHLRNPTKDQLKDAIEDFVYRFGAQPDNRVLIYYAGHGHPVGHLFRSQSHPECNGRGAPEPPAAQGGHGG